MLSATVSQTDPTKPTCVNCCYLSHEYFIVLEEKKALNFAITFGCYGLYPFSCITSVIHNMSDLCTVVFK